MNLYPISKKIEKKSTSRKGDNETNKSIYINMVDKVTGEIGSEKNNENGIKLDRKLEIENFRLSLLFILSHVFIYGIIQNLLFPRLSVLNFHYIGKYANIMLCTIHTSEMKLSVAVIHRNTGRSHYCYRYKCCLTLVFACMSAPLSSSAVAVSV